MRLFIAVRRFLILVPLSIQNIDPVSSSAFIGSFRKAENLSIGTTNCNCF